MRAQPLIGFLPACVVFVCWFAAEDDLCCCGAVVQEWQGRGGGKRPTPCVEDVPHRTPSNARVAEGTPPDPDPDPNHGPRPDVARKVKDVARKVKDVARKVKDVKSERC